MPDRWWKSAACRDESTEVFFDNIWPDAAVREPLPEPLEIARDICRYCMVRPQCLATKLAEEVGSAVMFRYGLVALLTPEQRHWLEKHGPEEPVADPIELDIPDMGHDWQGRHTKLARNVLAWIVEHVPMGEPVPGPQQMHEDTGIRRHDLHRVFKAFVEDGTLRIEHVDGNTRRYWRTAGAHGAVADWFPQHLTCRDMGVSETSVTLTTHLDRESA